MQLSIIICTKDRAALVGKCLESAAQSIAAAAVTDAEIIIVDNGSKDETSDVIKRWASTCPTPVQTLYEEKKGLSAARNCALRFAKGKLIAFTDDDCEFSKEYVRDLLRRDAADTEPVLRGGRVELGNPNDLPFSIKTSGSLTRWHRQQQPDWDNPLSNSLVGCNIAMRRAVIDRVGLFDERFGPGTNLPGSEDTDYIYRAYLADIAIEYVPDMVVYHFHGRKLSSEGNKLFKNYMLGTGGLYIKYLFKSPSLCHQFFWDVKNAIKEALQQKNNFLPAINFSHKAKVTYCLRGALTYCLLVLKIQTVKKWAAVKQLFAPPARA